MGIDFIGWRECELQRELEPSGFLTKLKLREYRRAVETRVPESKRASIQIRVRIHHPDDPHVRAMSYPELIEELGSFDAGIPACADCPLSDGTPVGCYRYVAYPIDSSFEEDVFEYFATNVSETDHVCHQIWTDLVQSVEDEDEWYEWRGSEVGALAARSQPIRKRVSIDGAAVDVDSAQLLSALFAPPDDPEATVAFALFWQLFFGWFDKTRSRNIADAADGAVEIHLAATTPEELNKEVRSVLTRVSESRTHREMRDVAALYATLFQHVVAESWSLIVDG